MNGRNLRKSTPSIGVAPLVKWVALGIVLVLYGLFFVNLSHQALRSGQKAAELEARLKKLNQENVSAESHIAWLRSRQQLERSLVTLGSNLKRIPEDRIVWLSPSRTGDGEIRAASFRKTEIRKGAPAER